MGAVLAQGRRRKTTTGPPPEEVAPSVDDDLALKAIHGHVHLRAEQKKTMHFGCVTACVGPVESKCVTACEAAMYKCIDETGPNETPKDTEACQGKVLKLYKETKGIEKKEEKKEEKAGKDAKKEEKKAKFLQAAPLVANTSSKH